MWTNDGVTLVFGDRPQGWRAATQLEIDAYNAKLAADAAQAAADTKDVNKVDKFIRAACIYFGQLNGKTPAQVRAGILAVYDSLP